MPGQGVELVADSAERDSELDAAGLRPYGGRKQMLHCFVFP